LNTKKILQFSIGPIRPAVLGLVTLPIVAWLFSHEDIYMTAEIDRLVRLHMYYGMESDAMEKVINIIRGSYNEA
jgi:hypothetical protein